MRKMWFLTVILLVAVLATGDDMAWEMERKWTQNGNAEPLEISFADVTHRGRKVRAARFVLRKKDGMKKWAGAETRFHPKHIDISQYTNFSGLVRCNVKIDGKNGRFSFADGKWKGASIWYDQLFKNKFVPGEWVEFSYPVELLKKQFNAADVMYFAFGLGDFATLLKDGDVTLEFADFKFSRPVTEWDAKRAAFDKYIKNYRPDYSDSSAMLLVEPANRLATPKTLVRNGAPVAEIVYSQEEPRVVATAAAELQQAVRQITGATLPIIDKGYWGVNWKDGKKRIVLGKRTLLPDKFDADLQKISGSDGFAIRVDGNNIHIFGTEGKGVMNGVFTLLEQNTDIIWARPNTTFGTVYSEKKDLDILRADCLRRPDTRTRGWNGYADTEWISRNGGNAFYGGGGGDIGWTNPKKNAYGIHLVRHMFGHNIGHFVPSNKYLKSNPEFFSFSKAKNKRVPWQQYCFANAKMREIFLDSALKFLRRAPEDTRILTIDMDDTWGCCECAACTAPITLKSGEKITVADPAFRSTQYFMFLNDIIKGIHREFPGMQIKTLAYFSTATPPKCDVDPNIRPEFAPYVRVNDKTPLFAPENIEWLDNLRGWSKKSDKIDVYEYHGLGLGFPRPLAEVRAWDFKEMNPYIVGISSEYIHAGDKNDNMKMWDMSAMEFWVISRLLWDCRQDVEKLRKYYIRRTFREGAPAIERFYGEIRRVWFQSQSASTLGSKPVSAVKEYVIDGGIEDTLRAALAEAKKTVRHPASKIMIDRLSDRFEEYVSAAKAQKAPAAAVPLVRTAQIPGFDSDVWSKSAVLANFSKVGAPGNKSSDYRTEVRAFHDSEKLYLKLKCSDPDMAGLVRATAAKGQKEQFPDGDHMEIFLAPGKNSSAYWLFAADADNVRCDLKQYDAKCNSAWRSSARRGKDFYEIIAVVPLADIGVSMAQNTVKAQFIREVAPRNGGKRPREYSGWGPAAHHDHGMFGELTLMR